MSRSTKGRVRPRAPRDDDFEDDERSAPLESYDAEPLRRQVAAALLGAALRAPSEEDALRLTSIASDVFHCGTPRDLLWADPSRSHIVFQSCRHPALCSRCSSSRAFKCAQKDAARVGWVLTRFPRALILQARVVIGESVDLRSGVSRLFDLVREQVESGASPWDRVVAGIAQAHPQRGRGGCWRPHMHLILLIEPRGQAAADHQFARELGLTRLRKVDDGWTGKAGTAQWFVRRCRGQNSSRPDVVRRIGAAPEAHAYRLSRYDADHVLEDVDDRVRVFLALRGVQLRRMWGLVRGVSDKDLQDAWDAIERDNPDLARRVARLFSGMEKNPHGSRPPTVRPGPAILEARERRAKRYEEIAQELRSRDARRKARTSTL